MNFTILKMLWGSLSLPARLLDGLGHHGVDDVADVMRVDPHPDSNAGAHHPNIVVEPH